MSLTKSFERIEVDTWREAENGLLELTTSGRDVLFRGHADADWTLQSKFDRMIAKLATKHNWTAIEKEQAADRIERELLDEFRRAYRRISKGPRLPKEVETGDEFMAFAQHFGVPTRLLDWSRSPYIAAFFAFAGNDTTSVFPSGHRAAIWAFDWDRFKEYLYWRQYKTNPDKMPGEPKEEVEKRIQLSLTSADRRIEKVQIVGNPNRRMVYQEGLFTRVVGIEDDIQAFLDEHEDWGSGTVLTKIEVPGGEQRRALQELSLMAITPVSLMNDPDGAAATAVNAVIRFRFG